MNHEGCSNTLSAECNVFHRDYGKVRSILALIVIISEFLKGDNINYIIIHSQKSIKVILIFF